MAKFEISVDNKASGGTFDVGTRYAVRVYIDVGYGGAKVGDYVKTELQHGSKPSIRIGRQKLVASGNRLYMAFYWTPTSGQVGSWTIRGILERDTGYKSSVYYVDVESTAPVQQYVYFRVRDDEGNPVNHAKIECAGESFYTDSDGKVIRPYAAGATYYATCYAPTGYECTDCSESFYLDSAEFINFYMKAAVEPTPPPTPEPKPECTEGDKKPDKICVGGKWEDALCMEGTYTADRRMVCRGGVWVLVTEEPEVRKYITVEEANERVRMGLPCYIKCVLPILDLIPGLPYTPGAWVPPLCAITEEP
ncbi:hypothetical protein KAW18_08335 [candidate division WOR-3 bacterium]|nr:hypothetical protein [candidate division WOR-3 bacterium]